MMQETEGIGGREVYSKTTCLDPCGKVLRVYRRVMDRLIPRSCRPERVYALSLDV